MKNHNRIMIGAIAAILVLALLGVPIGGLALLVFLIACPLMMFFMMGDTGHGHGRSREGDDAHAGHDR